MLTRLALEGFRCRAGWVHCFLMHSQKLPLPKALEQTCLAVKVLCSSEEFSPLDMSPGIFGTDAMLRISHKGAVCFYKLCVLEPETVFFRLFMFTCLFFFLSFLVFFFFLIMVYLKHCWIAVRESSYCCPCMCWLAFGERPGNIHLCNQLLPWQKFREV